MLTYPIFPLFSLFMNKEKINSPSTRGGRKKVSRQNYSFCTVFFVEPVIEVGMTKAGLGIRSFHSNPMSDCERFAQIALDK